MSTPINIKGASVTGPIEPLNEAIGVSGSIRFITESPIQIANKEERFVPST